MKSIKDQEDDLFERWKKEIADGFCADGLLWNGKEYETCSSGRHSGNEEELWLKAKRKVLFFMKEPNNNPDEDYREWNLEGNTSSTFFRFIYSWLNGLSVIDADSTEYPPITKTFPEDKALLVVNAKKSSGGATADDNEVYDHAKKYAKLLREQFDIYKPNIILCGGGYTCSTREVITQYIVTHLIYPEIEFTQMDGSNWIWYSKEHKIVLINSYHPVSRTSNEAKYNTMLDHFQKFLKLKVFDL